MAVLPDAHAVGVDRQRRLLALLACPRCRAALDRRRATERDGALVDADLRCASCGDVGVVRAYRPSFHPADLGDAWLPAGLAEAPVDLSAEPEKVGTWGDLPLGLLGSGIGACVTGTTDAAGIVVTLGTHDWGAAALVSCGDEEHRIELYSVDPGTQRVVVAQPQLAGQSRRWSVVIAPGASRGEWGERTQAIVRSVSELVPADAAPPLVHRPSNRGNPYPPRLAELLADAPPDATVVDLGGGDRCHDDPRVLNFEYLHFDNADFFGDGLSLPIGDDSVDLLVSQAVLEHVPDPQRAVDEMRRVLRPGGRLYAEFAFMQPLHAVPYHFFNITPHGASLLFDGWDVQHQRVFGGLATTMDWFFRLLGADRKIGEDRSRQVLDALADLDSQLSPTELEFVASAVSVEALKPS